MNQEVEFTVEQFEAIYAAWHGAGVDIAGGNWTLFVSMLNLTNKDNSELA